VIEKLRMKQVEDEYYKILDQPNSTQQQGSDSLIPPTPLKELFISGEKSGLEVNGEHQTTVKKSGSARVAPESQE
jgi:hypothetical protein